MIYNWTEFSDKLEFAECSKSDAKKHVPPELDLKEGEYFFVGVTNDHLLNAGSRYAHPNVDDVMVAGEVTYALVSIVSSSRQGRVWEFKLLVRKLVKEKMAPTKSFGVELRSP